MKDQKIIVVVPSIRPERMASFRRAWSGLFEKHKVSLITVWDGEEPQVHVQKWPKNVDDGRRPYSEYNTQGQSHVLSAGWLSSHRDLFCRMTDACRNIGFVYAAKFLNPDVVITMDDDVEPLTGIEQYISPGIRLEKTVADHDPIQAHLDALSRKVPISWMNTAHDTDLYLRGVPYGVRDESPVMLSHGVWVGTPDFDGETQLQLESQKEREGNWNRQAGVPHSLPYYVGPVPKGVLFPLCGMNVAVKKEALPYFYFAPMGPDSGVEGLNRFADIWMGIFLKRKFDELGWACVTGYSTVHHTRASDARKNFEQERLGREWNEWLWKPGYTASVPFKKYPDDTRDVPDEATANALATYLYSYNEKRQRYARLIRSALEGDK